MKKCLIFIILLSCIVACKESENYDPPVQTILIDASRLAKTKLRIEQKDPILMPAFDLLISQAERALKDGPFSVTHKDKLPPSRDQHDYASYSRYWWPDPDKPDGLPYIRRDGETNPESQSLAKSDRQRIGSLGMNTETLGLAYFFTEDERYAKKVAELLRVWFLEEETRMNPNLNHAQCRLGHNEGSRTGILDGRIMTQALEGSLLISNSTAFSQEEHAALKEWAAAYFEWLSQNKMAIKEAASKNNHGTYYDAQAMYFALFADQAQAAKDMADKFLQKRILTQIQSDGMMPEETARTRPLFYSMYNLYAMFLVAHLAEKVDVDVWQASDPNSRLRKALDYIVPYTDSTHVWPTPTIGKADRMDLYPIIQMAERAYPKENYIKMAEDLPLNGREIHRANLAFPLMR